MVGLQQYLFFKERRLNLIIIYDNIFSQRFHGVNFSILNFLHKEDFTKTASSNNTFDLEVLQINLFLSFVFHKKSVGSGSLEFIIPLINLIKTCILWLLGWWSWFLSAKFLFINIFFLLSKLLIWIDFNTFSDIFFSGSIIFQFVWNTIYW